MKMNTEQPIHNRIGLAPELETEVVVQHLMHERQPFPFSVEFKSAVGEVYHEMAQCYPDCSGVNIDSLSLTDAEVMTEADGALI